MKPADERGLVEGADPAGEASVDPGSFRDPHSRVFTQDGEVYRGLNAEGLRDFEILEASRFFADRVRGGDIVHTERAEPSVGSGRFAAVLRHEKIPFVSYPYQWPFSMLKDAALLTLGLLREALAEGVSLKDGTPYNVQFRGSRPTFVDVGSFEALRGGEPWYGYEQFCRLFLFPLLLQSHRHVAYHPWLRGSVDGIEVSAMRNLMGRRALFRRGVFKHVLLHERLQRVSVARRSSDVVREVKRAGFRTELLMATVKSLEKVVGGLMWEPERSAWTAYHDECTYTTEDRTRKLDFVHRIGSARERKIVWDLGANDGTFSRAVSDHAQTVVAADSDHGVVDALYRSLREEAHGKILPLVVDVADTSGGIGWRGRERRSFLEQGRPELTLCLALVHHLAISSNIPLTEIVGWLRDVGGEVVVEFPERDDPQVQRLLRTKREGLHDAYTLTAFESALDRAFKVLTRETLPSGTRVLYHARPR